MIWVLGYKFSKFQTISFSYERKKPIKTASCMFVWYRAVQQQLNPNLGLLVILSLYKYNYSEIKGKHVLQIHAYRDFKSGGSSTFYKTADQCKHSFYKNYLPFCEYCAI